MPIGTRVEVPQQANPTATQGIKDNKFWNSPKILLQL